MCTTWNTRGSFWTAGNTFLLWGWQGTVTGCPGRCGVSVFGDTSEVVQTCWFMHGHVVHVNSNFTMLERQDLPLHCWTCLWMSENLFCYHKVSIHLHKVYILVLHGKVSMCSSSLPCWQFGLNYTRHGKVSETITILSSSEVVIKPFWCRSSGHL